MTETSSQTEANVTQDEVRRRLKPFRLPKSELAHMLTTLDTPEKLDKMCEALHKWYVQRLQKRIDGQRNRRYNDGTEDLIILAQGIVGPSVLHAEHSYLQPMIEGYPDAFRDAMAGAVASSPRRGLRLRVDHNGQVELMGRAEGGDRETRLTTVGASNAPNIKLFWRTFSRILLEQQLNGLEADPRFPVECTIATLLLLSGRNAE
jgi:hypothetical protein